MHQILILSGKGGTGKTTVASSFIKLSQAKAYADCDVDAPNLHLVSGQFSEKQDRDYFGLPKAVIDQDLCIGCNRCYEVCHFDAIVVTDGQYSVNPIACEGCSYCAHVCKANAITMHDEPAGLLHLYTREDEHFSTATLLMGSGTTGKLVTEVKKQLDGAKTTADVAILDGSPGIGCPVIASLSGVDLALMVAEPSLSGISDLKRVVQSAKQLKVPVAVMVNKYDTNEAICSDIETYCQKEGLPFVGKVPYDTEAVRAINEGKTLIEIDSKGSEAMKDTYYKTLQVLKEYKSL